MEIRCKKISVFVVLVMGLCLTASFASEESQSPDQVIKDFASAYYMLDPVMEEYLCNDCKETENEVNAVDLFLEIAEYEAYNRGFKKSFLRKMPLFVETKVLEMNDTSARVKVDLILTRSINPLFRAVGYIFQIQNVYDVEEIVYLVNEEGHWKIGPGAFGLPK
ncbi:MAG: hypothetical protein GY729_10625 [Desulfobacteraceae bacterium]|nr:hypothetical protein [Desulfobacteraceae bacterium]